MVTDQTGRVYYANATYLDLIGAVDNNDVRPIERVFIGDPDVSEAIYSAAQGRARGPQAVEEVRIAGGGTTPARWMRLRVRPLGDTKRDARMSVWSVADVTRERARAENVFQELQRAIDYLDHAPAGFFSVDAGGTIVYLNATLADWLGHDLAEVGAGALKLADIVAGEGAVLLTTLNAAPGEVKTEVLDLDLKTRSGKPLPVQAVPQGRLWRRRRRRFLAHAGAQPRARCRLRPATRGGSPLHALLPEHADGNCHRG